MTTTMKGRAEDLRRSPAGSAVTDAGKAVVRAGAVLSAATRPGPDLLVIGAKRGGTTSLWRYLAEHPGVLPTVPRAERIKGAYFFDENFDRGEAWYRSHFATAARRAVVARRLGYAPVTMDATPYYLFHPLAPVRAARVVPDAHVVAVLRDPVERAFSHWKERRQHSEALPFAAALDAEATRTAWEEERIVADPHYVSFPHRHQTYLAQGCYAPMLERWFAAYPRHQVSVFIAEEFYADPQAVVDELCSTLGLPRRALADPSPFNAEPSEEMAPALRQQLRAYLAPEVQKVESLLGRSLPWH